MKRLQKSASVICLRLLKALIATLLVKLNECIIFLVTEEGLRGICSSYNDSEGPALDDLFNRTLKLAERIRRDLTFDVCSKEGIMPA